MLIVQTNQTQYEYDIHSLVKAFAGEQKVKVVTPDTIRPMNQKWDEPTINIEMKTEICMEIIYDNKLCINKPITNNACVMEEKISKKYKMETAAKADNINHKDRFKGFLYESLCDFTNKKLPWGNLTGIRPTKLSTNMLESGCEKKEILDFLQKKHYVSEQKAELCYQISELENKLLSTIHYEKGYSLYIGIPFCPTTCLYCSFTSYPIGAFRDKVERYIDCLIREMEFVAANFQDRILDSVYIGGGTPTTLEANQLERILKSMRQIFDLSGIQEFTVEAGRADSITKEKLEVLSAHGVTRISVNPQTMKGETLKLIGRNHTVEQVKEAFALARKAGFTNINMDLILGLPGETKEDVIHTMAEIKKLNPDSLTVHSLAVKRASGLNHWIEEHGISMLNNTDETMELAAGGAIDLEMQPYYLYRQKNMSGNFENVGYAKEGKYGIYNILIMEEKQTIMALGAGSISKLVMPDGRIERADNIKDVDLYIEKIDEMIHRKKQLLETEENGADTYYKRRPINQYI